MLVAKTKGPDEWKAVTSAISTLVEEATFEATIMIIAWYIAKILGITSTVINFLIFTKNNMLKKSRSKTFYNDNMDNCIGWN